MDKLVISDDVLSQEVSGETVLLDMKSEQYFGLDEVGTRIWQLLREGNSRERVLEVMQNEYEASRRQLAADLDDLLKRLLEAGLITVEASPAD